jgi:molybdopterin-guanine dinucleotide biosynthesis protein A
MIGIYSCLKRSSTPWIMVLSCDMPLAEPQWLATLLTNRHPYDVIFPVHHDGCIEPLCAAYNKRIIPEFERYISDGNFSLRQLVVEAKHKMIEVDDASAARMFININTSQDFDLLNKS